jgi:tetratricopeptide (TPR) repeat protein
MKNNKIIAWGSLLVSVWLAFSCSHKTVFPVSDPSKVKPLNERQRLEKELYFSEALKCFELQDWAAANVLFRKTIGIDPGCDACFYKLASIYLHSGYPDRALSLSRSAVRLDSTNFWYRMQLAQIYAVNRAYDKAIVEYRRLLRERPATEDLYFDLATLHTRINQLDSALHVLQQADAKLGFTEQSAGVQVEILMAQERDEEAEAMLVRLVEAFPEARYYSLLGEHYSSTDRDSLALQMFQNALTLNADYPPALLGEVDFYRRQGDFERYFQKLYGFCANKNVEDDYKVDYLSAMIRIPNFVPTFSAQLDSVFLYLRTPPGPLTEPLYATYLLHSEQADSAATVLKINLRNHPEQSTAWHQYLAIEYYRNEWDTLSVYAGRAHERFPDEVDFISMKAMSLWQTKEEAEAITWFEKALPLIADDPKQTKQTYAFLGDLYYMEKNPKKAFENYERALAIDSGYVLVLNNFAYFLSEENKQLDKAYAMSKKAIEAEPDNATYLDTFGWILYKMGKAIEAKAIFRHAMVYGGKESAVILDHYGDVLRALGETDMAVLYWEMSLQKEPSEEVAQKIALTK